jgi:hypothetical protein
MGHQPDKEVEKMIELLHPDGGRWDIDKMNETFIEADVEDILKIPVGRAETYDYISQNYTQKNICLVLDWHITSNDILNVWLRTCGCSELVPYVH